MVATERCSQFLNMLSRVSRQRYREIKSHGDITIALIGESKDLSKSLPKVRERLHQSMVNFLDEVGAETRKLGSKTEVYENAKPL